MNRCSICRSRVYEQRLCFASRVKRALHGRRNYNLHRGSSFKVDAVTVTASHFAIEEGLEAANARRLA
jgi:hypothetical protein